MVTSPNWMAPFHIARATAAPRAGPPVEDGQPARMIAPSGKPSVSQDRPPPSTKDDEGVQVDAAVAGRAELDRVGPEGGERHGVHHDPARAGARPEADGLA